MHYGGSGYLICEDDNYWWWCRMEVFVGLYLIRSKKTTENTIQPSNQTHLSSPFSNSYPWMMSQGDIFKSQLAKLELAGGGGGHQWPPINDAPNHCPPPSRVIRYTALHTSRVWDLGAHFHILYCWCVGFLFRARLLLVGRLTPSSFLLLRGAIMTHPMNFVKIEDW